MRFLRLGQLLPRIAAALCVVLTLASCGGGADVADVTPGEAKVLKTTAATVQPEVGVWWNPAESGSGYVLELQGNTLVLGVYRYDVYGAGVWYSGLLQRSADGASFSGVLFHVVGGQSLLGPYQKPSDSAGIAPVVFKPSSPKSGVLTITYGGGTATIPIQKLNFGAGSAVAAFQSGTWWNPAESGRGFIVDVQGNMAALSSYMYDKRGQPTWYLTIGQLTDSFTFSGELEIYQGGQELGRAYKAPSRAGTAGKVTFKATSATTANLTLPDGRVVPLQRLSFGQSQFRPDTPAPANLWKPPAGAVPSTGNYVYMESDPSDYVAKGAKFLYTSANAVLTVSMGRPNNVLIDITGDQRWHGGFGGMMGTQQLLPGYYAEIESFRADSVMGGVGWGGEGNGCPIVTGWMMVDAVKYTNGAVDSFKLRFEQHCDGAPAALRGEVNWSASDPLPIYAPVNPVPPNLWRPAAGTMPATGSYVYLESQPGEFVGDGGRYLYTSANAVLKATQPRPESFVMDVDGDEKWNGGVEGKLGMKELQPGYYADIRRVALNPVRGGLSWGGESRGCHDVTGWYVVDSVKYTSGTLEAIKLRFEQYCDGLPAPLRGEINWVANEKLPTYAPINPPPAALWAPPFGSTPTSGNYVYLQSDPGDFIGEGQAYRYTSAESKIVVTTTQPGSQPQGAVSINVDRAADWWLGQFMPMNNLTRLVPGYYPDLRKFSVHNPVTGGFKWGGMGGGCNESASWVVVDSVSYSSNGEITALKLRFEQHCEFDRPALRGEVNWAR